MKDSTPPFEQSKGKIASIVLVIAGDTWTVVFLACLDQGFSKIKKMIKKSKNVWMIKKVGQNILIMSTLYSIFMTVSKLYCIQLCLFWLYIIGSKHVHRAKVRKMIKKSKNVWMIKK